MQIGLNVEATGKALKKMKDVPLFSNYLSIEMGKYNYTTVNKILYVLNCYDPNFGAFSKEWENGTVIRKKYARSKRYVEIHVKINHSRLLNATRDQVYDLITEAILKTKKEVDNLAIPKFPINDFYRDLSFTFNQKLWKSRSDFYIPPNFEYKAPVKNETRPYKEMKEKEFWSFIKDSASIAEKEKKQQIISLVNLLHLQEEKKIIGFEITLRQLLKKAHDFNVLALAKAVEGIVTDDSFLYFRAKLILLGEKIFNQAIDDPNLLGLIIENDLIGEELLGVADDAYKLKSSTDHEGELPTDLINDTENCDSISAMTGIEWNEKNFTERYSSLLNKYNK